MTVMNDDAKETVRDWETRRDLALQAAHRKAARDALRAAAPWVLGALTLLALCCAGLWRLAQ